MSLLQDDVKKRKIINEEENSKDDPEEGECSESEKDDGILDEISPDISINSESDHEEEQGYLCFFFFLTFVCFYFIFFYRFYKIMQVLTIFLLLIETLFY